MQRALFALGLEPSLCHMNEGHSAFLAVENLKRSGADSLAAAIEGCRPRHVFTTHTPVPAGNEVFERERVRPHLASTAAALGATTDELLELGRNSADPDGFNLTALALALSHRANGVSQLHAEVSRKMWPGHEIDGITMSLQSPLRADSDQSNLDAR